VIAAVANRPRPSIKLALFSIFGEKEVRLSIIGIHPLAGALVANNLDALSARRSRALPQSLAALAILP
jgi:hypothetical protein